MYYIKNFRYIKDYKIKITFNDNKSKVVNLENHLNGKIFEPLQDINFFFAILYIYSLTYKIAQSSVTATPKLLAFRWENMGTLLLQRND